MKNTKLIQISLLIALFGFCISPAFAQKKKKDKNNPWTSLAPTKVKEWDGVYLGSVPCADCEGIKTMIRLTKDNKFVIQTKYVGKGPDVYEDKGKIYWNKDGFTLLLLAGKDSSYAKIADNKLILLDRDGKLITGPEAPYYTLSKDKVSILEKYWRLVELNGKPIADVAGRTKEPFIMFKAGTPSFSGNGGCNTLLGKYELGNNNKIGFSNLVTTMMSCPDLDTEQALRDALESTDHFIVTEEFLKLEDANKRSTAKFVCVYLK